MKQIDEYILLSLKDRQAHLKLNDPCIERGGLSTYCKALLAHVLDTTIPSGSKIHVCHACNNPKCSNPAHLYWGTSKENKLDARRNGVKTVWEYTVEKYGEEKARELNRRSALHASKAGKGNLGKKKSEEHKRKISEAIKKKNAGVA